MENSADSSSSDKDKKMKLKSSFETSSGDDTDTKKEKKADKKTPPRRSLFLSEDDKPKEKVESVPSFTAWLEKKSEQPDNRKSVIERLLRESADDDSSEKQPSEDHDKEPALIDQVEHEASHDDEAGAGHDTAGTTAEAVDTPTEEEISQRFKEFVDEKRAELPDAPEAAGETDQAAELAADGALLDNVSEKIDSGTEAEEAIEEALADAMQEDVVAELRAENTERSEDTSEEAAENTEPLATATTHTASPSTTVSGSTSGSASTPASSAARGGGATPPPPATYGASGSGGGFRPPPPGGAAPNMGFNAPQPNHNYAPTPLHIPDAYNTEVLDADPAMSRMNEHYYRRKNTGRVILAGLLGYAIGRRGGRKRTEARLQPEVDEGSKRVGELEQKLDQSQQEVQKKVRESRDLSDKLAEHRAQPETTAAEQQLMYERQEQFAQHLDQPEQPAVNIEPDVSEPVGVEQAYQSISLGENPVETRFAQATAASEANAESTPIDQVERKKPAPTPEAIEQKVDAQAMTMPELLKAAEAIDTGSGTLREMYEHRRIDAVNLRKVVAEHAAGRNYESFLKKSLEAEEIKRELRNEVKTDDGAGLAAGADTAASGASQGAVTTQSASLPNFEGEGMDLELAAPQRPAPVFEPFDQQAPTSFHVSTTTAIILGVIAGILLAVIVLAVF